MLSGVRTSKRQVTLPIGRTARVAFQMEALREACSRAARLLVRQTPLDEEELEECARLDDALAQAQRILKITVRGLVFSRLRRRSRKS